MMRQRSRSRIKGREKREISKEEIEGIEENLNEKEK